MNTTPQARSAEIHDPPAALRKGVQFVLPIRKARNAIQTLIAKTTAREMSTGSK